MQVCSAPVTIMIAPSSTVQPVQFSNILPSIQASAVLNSTLQLVSSTAVQTTVIPSPSQSSIVQNSTGQFRTDTLHSNFSCYATIPNIDCTVCIDVSFSNISFCATNPNINCTACADISGSNFDCCTTYSIQINCPACTDIDQRLILL